LHPLKGEDAGIPSQLTKSLYTQRLTRFSVVWDIEKPFGSNDFA